MSSAAKLISDLVAIDTLKTWSVIVTLFGDLDGDHLSGAQVRALLAHADIKPEAIRVALHRLKKDGWILAEKEGREAYYRLTDFGRQETANAAQDVYRSSPKYSEAPRFALVPAEDRDIKFPRIARDVVLIPPDHSIPPDIYPLHHTDKQIPQWLEHAIISPRFLEIARLLARVVTQVNTANFDVSDRDQQVLRLLILHHWRRIALRAECWAHIALLPDGAVAHCHRPVVEFLKNSTSIRVDHG